MIDGNILGLYYLSACGGLVMVVGGIVLLYRQKISIDKAGRVQTEITTPLGKFKTNSPALVLFALGFVPLIYPMYQLAGLAKQVTIRGNVKAVSVSPQMTPQTSKLPSVTYRARLHVQLRVRPAV
jgi:hypothetical protein